MTKGLGVDGDRIEMREGGRGDIERVDGRLVTGNFALLSESQQLALLWRLDEKAIRSLSKTGLITSAKY